jgi:hypothetical protein
MMGQDETDDSVLGVAVIPSVPRFKRCVSPGIVVIAITAALAVANAAAAQDLQKLHPVSCFRSHGWRVKGTNLRGTARKPQRDVPRKYWSYVTWYGPPPYSYSDFATNRQKRLIKLCLGR